MKNNIFELFPTTIIEYDLSNHPGKKDLVNYIDNYSNAIEHGLVENGITSYSTKSSFLGEPTFINLKNDIQKCIDNYCCKIGISPVHIHQSWFNVMFKGGRVGTHNHGGSILSGAYYPILEKGSCDLFVKNPIERAIIFDHNIYPDTNYQYNDINISIKQDHLYIFPGFLHHYTLSNESNKRVVVSFNTKFY